LVSTKKINLEENARDHKIESIKEPDKIEEAKDSAHQLDIGD